jgi:predicted nuclease with TOPRIM domain
MEDKLCEARHQRIEEKFDTHERRINNHSERIDRIELNSGRLEERLDNLIRQLASLNSTMKWFMGLLLGAFVSFFFYAVQQGVF